MVGELTGPASQTGPGTGAGLLSSVLYLPLGAVTLLDHLATVPDPRRAQGRRYPLPGLLAMAIMAVLSGHHGYRPTERFIRDNADALRRLLDWPRQAMPSNVSLRAVLQAVDFDALASAFRAWATERMPNGEVLAVDAKAVRSTVTGHEGHEQDFVALVSAYGVRSGIVVTATRYHNGQTSPPHLGGVEVAAAQDLIADLASALDLTGVTVTLDALHAVKKRSATSGPLAGTTSSSSSATAAGSMPSARRTSTQARR